MPELPEVQTIVNDLNKKIIGRRITGVWFDWARTIKRPKAGKLAQLVKGAKIERVKRTGKNILIYLDKNKLILVHQKLTGHLLVGKWRIAGRKPIAIEPTALKEKVNDYIHLIFYLDNGQMLGLSDLRKFAKVLCGPKEEIENLPELKGLGPDSLGESFKVQKFQSLIAGEKRKIKQVLLDQTVVAGIGNIYSDDILWQAKVNPFKPANGLSSAESAAIYKAMKAILNKAVKLRGTSTSDFRDTAGKAGGYTEKRLVYQREGEPCRRCKTPIKRIKMAGRSAHFCSQCQKL